MAPSVGFPLFLAITLAFLAAAVATGLAARRPLHLLCVAGAMVCLGVTVYFAEQLGELYDLESAGWITPLHLMLAKLTVAAYLLPVVTGVRTIQDVTRKPTHRKVITIVLSLTVATAITGTAMLLMATPLA